MIPCICIDDTGKPEVIPVSKWVKRGEQYRIATITYHPLQGLQGCDIYERPLDESCLPYQFFKLSRFAIAESDIPAFIELMKQSTELNDIDIQKLVDAGECPAVLLP
jgi:hypothetical protein